jgi:aryl carrier-like protein
MARKGTSTGSSGCTGTGTSAWTPKALRAEVAALLGTELTVADDDTDLFALGLQSIQLMQLTNRINRAGGRTGFTELARDPRLTSWHRLLSSRAEAAGERPVPAPPHRDGSRSRSPRSSRRTGSAGATTVRWAASAATPTWRSTRQRSTPADWSRPYVP